MRLMLPALSEIATLAFIVALVLGGQIACCILYWAIRFLYVRWMRALALLRREVARIEKVMEGPLLTNAPVLATIDDSRMPSDGRFSRRLKLALCSSLILSLSGLVAVQFFFFDDVIRMAFSRAEAKSGVTFEFDKAEGSLLRGSVLFRNLRVRRDVHPACMFDVSIGETTLNIDFFNLFIGKLSFSNVRLAGVTGTYHRTAAPIDKPPRWPFEVERLDMSDVSLLVSDESRGRKLVDLPLIIAQSNATHLRSDWAANDVLFHTNANGTFDGEPLELRCERQEQGYRFTWNAPQLSVGLLSSFFGEFWNVFETGDATVHIEGITRPDFIAMDVSIEADGLKLSQKTLLGQNSERIDAIIRKCVEREDGKLELSVTLKMDKRAIKNELSPEAAPIWAMLANAVTDKQADLCGITPDTLRESGRRARMASSAFQTRQKSDISR